MAENTKNYRYNLYINGREAADELAKVERETVKLEKNLLNLKRQNKENTQEFRDLEAQVIANYQKFDTLRKAIDINKMSIGQLKIQQTILAGHLTGLTLL